MKLINRQYIPGYGNLRVISCVDEIATIMASGRYIGTYNTIGKAMFRYMCEYILIPFSLFREIGIDKQISL